MPDVFALGRGHHRRHRDHPAPPRIPERHLLTEPAAGGGLTVDELRGFLADVDEAAEYGGFDPGGLRPWAAVRLSGAIKGIGLKLPRGGGPADA